MKKRLKFKGTLKGGLAGLHVRLLEQSREYGGDLKLLISERGAEIGDDERALILRSIRTHTQLLLELTDEVHGLLIKSAHINAVRKFDTDILC